MFAHGADVRSGQRDSVVQRYFRWRLVSARHARNIEQ